MDIVPKRIVCVCGFETSCTGRHPQDHGDRKAWWLEYCRRNSQPWSSFWETTAAARIILSSCLHKREDLFYKHPVISWTHICGHSRSELHHWGDRFIFWPDFSLFQQTLPDLNALSLGTIFFHLLMELVITASSSQSLSMTRRTLGKFCAAMLIVVTHLRWSNNQPWKKRAGYILLAGCKVLKIRWNSHALINSYAEVFIFSWNYTSHCLFECKGRDMN